MCAAQNQAVIKNLHIDLTHEIVPLPVATGAPTMRKPTMQRQHHSSIPMLQAACVRSGTPEKWNIAIAHISAIPIGPFSILSLLSTTIFHSPFYISLALTDTVYIRILFFFWFYQSATPHRLFELKGCNNRLLVLEKKLDGALIWFCFFAISPLHWIARACYIFSFCLCACVSLFCVIILQKPHKGAAPCELTATRMQAFFFLPDSFPISFHLTATIRLNGDAPGIPVHLFVA